MADRDQGAQCARAGARQADRSAARTGSPAQRGRAGGGVGLRRRRRVPRQLPAGDPPGEGGSTEGVRRMSMDFGFDVISAQEYERQRKLYEPLTAAIRRLI